MVHIGTNRPVLNTHESDNEPPPEPGFARREAQKTPKTKRPTRRDAGSLPDGSEVRARKEGARGGTRGFPRD
jgi:hypothetical protein